MGFDECSEWFSVVIEIPIGVLEGTGEKLVRHGVVYNSCC